MLVGSNKKSFSANSDTTLMLALKHKGYISNSSLEQFKSQTTGKQLMLLPDSVTRPVKDGRGDMLVQSLKKTMELLSVNKKGFLSWQKVHR